jgi:PrtD family type I secretion system ABC transporter
MIERTARRPDQTVIEKTVATTRGSVLAVAVISLFVNLLMLTVPLYMLQLFDRVLASRSEPTLVYLTIVAVGALAVLGALDMLRSQALIRVSTWVEQRLGPVALSRAVGAMLQSSGYGTQSLRDITQVRQFVASPALLTLFDAPWVPIYLAVIYLMHPTLGLIGVVGAVVLFSLAVVNDLVTRQALSEANNQGVRAMRKIDSAVRNSEVIESMGLMPGIVRRWLADNQAALALQEKASAKGAAVLAASKFVRLSLQIAMLGFGAYLVIQHQITGGVMIAASIILSRALQPVEQAIGAWKTMVSVRAAFRRLKDFFAEAPERTTDIALPAPVGNLHVDKVVFVPPGGKKPTLKGVTFGAKPGQIIAIVGPSAAGKSTLARLIVGAWKPSSGVVRLDGADVYTWDRVAFGQHVGYVPQDVELFDGTVAENIARLGEAPPEMVVEAARRAGVHALILGLPNGYSTALGADGANLSGGQRQRIALARALFGQPRMLVLDEPNANLDGEGEAALINAMVEAKKAGALVIFISHRPSLVSSCDHILMLRDGAVEVFGPREQVLSKLTRPPSQAPNPNQSVQPRPVTNTR